MSRKRRSVGIPETIRVYLAGSTSVSTRHRVHKRKISRKCRYPHFVHHFAQESSKVIINGHYNSWFQFKDVILLPLSLSSIPPSNPFYYFLMSWGLIVSMMFKYSTTKSILPPYCNPFDDHDEGHMFFVWVNLAAARSVKGWNIYMISHPISILSPIRKLRRFCSKSRFIREQESRTIKE